jgi:hypothetical protein
MGKIIELSNGGYTIVDDADYDWLAQYTWSDNGIGYVQGVVAHKRVLMHRLIMGAAKGQEVDHINRVKYDNRRENLRFCTRSENMKNVAHVAHTPFQRRRRNSSGYMGVYFDNKPNITNKWAARIAYKGKRHSLGYHATAEAAARRYDEEARKLYGPDAKTNFQ